MEDKQKTENLLRYIEQLKIENENLKKQNTSLYEVVKDFKDADDVTIQAIQLKQAMNELKELKEQYKKEVHDITLLKAEYKAKIEQLVKQYTK